MEIEIIQKVAELKKIGKYGRVQAMRDFGLTEGRARRIVKQAEQYMTKTMEKQEVEQKPQNMTVKGITIGQLREKYDNTYIVQKNAENLERDVFLTNAEFVQLCNFANNAGYRNAIEHPQFDKYHGRAGGIIYWSHPDSIKKLKDEAVLK